jgi:hypothetical protein
MQVRYGNGGWCEVSGLDLPGRVYVRFAEVDGQPRVVELYVDGQGDPIQAGALRQFPVAALEEVTGSDPLLGEFEHTATAADLSRLASHFATGFGRGTYSGRHCEHCEAPLRGNSDKALTDWVALAYLSQYRDEVPQPAAKRPPRPAVEDLPEPVLTAPENGLTDAFLGDVARAYRASVARRMPPAKTLAALAGVDRRTVESWVYKARKRGIMPPATKRGRIV